MVDRLDPIALPLYLQQPRRKRRPNMGLSPEVIARRAVHAQQLLGQIANLIAKVQTLTPEQLKAVFVKVEHDAPISLSGTGLKAIIQHEGKETLAVVKNDLRALAAKIDEYGTGALRGKGYPPNSEIAHLLAIRELGPKERLSEALYQKYDVLINEDYVVVEVEMITLAPGRNQKRDELAAKLRRLNDRLGNGVYGVIYEHETDNRVRRAVMRCTGAVFKELVEDESWQDVIFWFDEKPIFETFHERWANLTVDNLGDTVLPEGDCPVVCIIDSGVNDQNFFLKGLVVAHKSFLSEKDNTADEYGHGSAVASLAGYHRLDVTHGAVNQARAWIANARILDHENAIDDRLLSGVLREVVEHFVALDVRIFNLSVGILNRKWNSEGQRTVPRKSWVARTIDVLSREHDIVFVISAGNIPAPRVTELHRAEPYPRYLLSEEARILDPAQAALAITVGSLAGSTQVLAAPSTHHMAERFEPSPFSRSGPGMARAIKPEVVELAGNMAWSTGFNRVMHNQGLAVVVASNAITPFAKTDYGTSYAAPMVAYRLAKTLQEFRRLEEPGACLLRALLVHSARIPQECGDVMAELDQVRPKAWLNVLGYGLPDESRVVESLDHRAVLYYQSGTDKETADNVVHSDQVLFFYIPLPPDFAASDGRKRLIITAAYAPRVQSLGIKTYLATKLKWMVYPGHVPQEQIIEYLSATMDEEEATREEATEEATEKATGPKEIRCDLGLRRRSRGTIQHDWYEWEADGFANIDSFTLAVVLQHVWGDEEEPIPFALVVTLEDESGVVPLYHQLRAQIDDIRVQLGGGNG